MAVKVLISRRLKSGVEVDMFLALSRLRSAAMDQAGYISGETLIGVKDPGHMVVLSVWDSQEHWERWRNDIRRRELEGDLDALLAEAPTYEVFRPGARS